MFCSFAIGFMWLPLLTWVDFNPSMENVLNPLQSGGWNYLCIRKFRRLKLQQWIIQLFTEYVLTWPYYTLPPLGDRNCKPEFLIPNVGDGWYIYFSTVTIESRYIAVIYNTMAQYSSYNDIKPVRLCTHGWHRPNMRAMGCLSQVLQRKNDRAISRAYCIMVQQQLEQLDSLWDCLWAMYFLSRASYWESCEFFKENWPRYIESSLPR